ncbi:tctex1 domain-containing protein 1-B-like [Mizuhopecten yessoensis]|uniref:Tctex1 domain-containing protein 1 n=1 Tax=Mizuhopecten yessoensis TaxID=6573 RepID=A0A210QF56_MIZYE|nr:tctex1 domain-containing protein 1-B-like [Mizuhopecten yessoensis]OWF47380.1 Tctex1 domain-containing protein 1 [Mizuhopecten yessoensis]
MSKVVKKTDRKKSMTRGDGAKSARKPSLNVDRKQSIKTERKSSVDPERKQSLMVADRKLSINSEERNMSMETAGTQRKASTFAERRSSIIGDTRRGSILEPMIGRSALITTSAQGQRPVNIILENTYKNCPDKVVRNDDIRRCIQEVFEQELPETTYSEEECCILSKRLAEMIKQSVKSLVQRHKIITVVALGQRQDYSPSVAFTSRCVWNANFDTFSEYTYKNTSLYAVGLVYVLYAE